MPVRTFHRPESDDHAERVDTPPVRPVAPGSDQETADAWERKVGELDVGERDAMADHGKTREPATARGLASLALASGTGEDVAALAASSPKPRWRLGARAVRALVLLAALAFVAVWGWLAFQKPSQAGSDGLVDERGGTKQPSLARTPSPVETKASATGPGPRAGERSDGGRDPGRKDSGRNGPGETVVVYVSGEVAKPGVYTVGKGARINDVVALAGGLTENADPQRTNLAAPVADGGHVHVAARGQTQEAPAGGDGPSSGGRINLNGATAEELERLPGVGPVTAAAIVQWRQKNGAFASVEDLVDVPGIGKATLAKIRDLVDV